MSDEGKAIGWNDEVEGTNDFTLLPEGTVVDFKVIDLKDDKDGRKRCNVAVLHLACKSPQGGTVIKERLTMHTDFLWKINQFFTSIGLRKPGAAKYRLDFTKVKGASGKAIVRIRKWKDDQDRERSINAIDRFLPHESFAGAGDSDEASGDSDEASGGNAPF